MTESSQLEMGSMSLEQDAKNLRLSGKEEEEGLYDTDDEGRLYHRSAKPSNESINLEQKKNVDEGNDLDTLPVSSSSSSGQQKLKSQDTLSKNP